ncbi:MAG: polysaccharide pyruvyl transferase family protein [Arachnia sp.]
MTHLDGIVICSFYTGDDYYRSSADALRGDLDRLGIRSVLEEIEKPEGTDWADICRKKIPFLARVCEENPNDRVFWIDVDCRLLDIPDYVRNSTADLLGFQRGFGSPLTIGYARRTRFWEPTFLGINATPGGRAFIAEAASREAVTEIKATDDYFFEEAWRAKADNLTFQILPSPAIIGRGEPDGTVAPFFVFGSSGNVAEFKGKVAQHTSAFATPGLPSVHSLANSARRRALRGAKMLHSWLPERTSSTLRRVADRSGVTHLLTGGAERQTTRPHSLHRSRLAHSMVMCGQRGETDQVARIYEQLATGAPPTAQEQAAHTAAVSFAHYMTPTGATSDSEPVRLGWWPRPFPGNFGDWLSPLVVSRIGNTPVKYQSLTAKSSAPHLVAVGSVGRFIKPDSVVVGTGLSSMDTATGVPARYVSVRGPLTAQAISAVRGPSVDRFGDPGILVSRIIPVTRGATNGRVAVVRHYTHAGVPLRLPEHVDELSVLVSTPDDIADFLRKLNEYDYVITSAMHVLIACHSYGIPAGLVTFAGLEGTVHGTGMKYTDYARGVQIADQLAPQPMGFDLTRLSLETLVSDLRVKPEVLDDVEDAVREALCRYTVLAESRAGV